MLPEVSVNTARQLIYKVGSSLAVRRHELLECARRNKRSDSLVRQILHKLRKKKLIYAHRDLVVNVPLLLMYYQVSLDFNFGKEDVARRESARALAMEGKVEEEPLADLVSRIVEMYLDDYRRFIYAVYQYYECWRELMEALKEEGEIDRILKLFVAYLGLLAPEAVQLVRMELLGERDLSLTRVREEFLGTRMFLSSLAKYLKDRRIERLGEAKQRLIKEVVRLRSGEDRHTRFYAAVFLELTIASAMDRILPRLYTPVRLVFYRLAVDKNARRKPGTGQDPRQ